MIAPEGAGRARAGHPLGRREVLAWAFYDWANSAYSTLSITVLVNYLQEDVLPGNAGILAWGWGIGVTTFLTALLSPVLGAVADAHASKRHWLAGTALTGAAASCLMFFATPERPWLLVALFLVANMALELSFCFYNAFLPEIAADDEMGRVSAWGYGLGYVGGGLALGLVVGLLLKGDQLGLPSDHHFRKRFALLLMGLWWGLFTLPAVLVLRDKRPPARERQGLWRAARRAIGEVGGTLRHIRRYRVLALFLLGFLAFNDGVQTVISQASTFAQKSLDMSLLDLIPVILMIQFVAWPGALLVGWLADRVGQKRMLTVCLLVWTAILVGAFFIQTKAQFWGLAAAVALVLGGVQSVSRSLMGLMTPERHAGEFFGFFNFSGKATSLFGPLFFSSIFAATGNANLALSSLLIFFIAGLAIIAPLDIAHGQQQARAE